MKFYTSDWRADPRLKMCSPAARGMWIEMICLMHEASPYGHLLIHGQTPNVAQLASLTGIPIAEVPHLVAELEQLGVFSRTKEGVIYSRKLVRMASRSAKAQKNGKKGGSPSLRKHDENNDPLNPQLNGDDKPQKPEARSQIDKEANASSSEQDAVDAYNRAAVLSGWPQVQRMSKPRTSALRARLKEVGGLPGWQAAIEKAAMSDFLCGRRPGRDGPFFASFDFLTQASSFTRLMEGSYDNRTQPSKPTQGRQDRPDPALERIARLAGIVPPPGHDRH